MFKYDEKVDQWSYEMVKDIAQIWGNPLVGNKPNSDLLAIKPAIDFLDAILDVCGIEIFKRLSFIAGVNIKLQDIDFFVNSVRVSLHNTEQRFVSISLHHPLDTYPTIIIHELFHIFFHELLYSNSLNNKLDEESITILQKKENEIKEYLTILINEEFSDLIDVEDEGYSEHKQIRNKVLLEWEKDKNLIGLLELILKNK